MGVRDNILSDYPASEYVTKSELKNVAFCTVVLGLLGAVIVPTFWEIFFGEQKGRPRR